MISLKHNFLFVHIPKTAGNSIQNVLSAYSEDKIVCLAPHQDGIERFEVRSDRYNIHKHSTLLEYRSQLDEEVFQRLFKFTSVRNPWDRLISFYFSPHRGQVAWDRQKFIKFVKEIPPVTDYISLEESNNPSTRRFNIDYFVRFENLNHDFKEVCKQIGVPYTPLPQRNKSKHQDYKSYYDDELVELVMKRFCQEIGFFGYKF